MHQTESRSHRDFFGPRPLAAALFIALCLTAAGDSVRITGPSGHALQGGRVVLDSVEAGSRVDYASVTGLMIHGKAPDVEHTSARGISVRDGAATLRHVQVTWLSAWSGSVRAEDVDIATLDGIYGDFTITSSTLERVQLSYSRASVYDSRFEGASTYIVFHGASGGDFERNAFVAGATDIAVRHTSDPVFSNNNFLSPSTQVRCETYQLPTCVHMERNWWGTTDEAEILRRFSLGCPVCYAPWLTGPVGTAAGPQARHRASD